MSQDTFQKGLRRRSFLSRIAAAAAIFGGAGAGSTAAAQSTTPATPATPGPATFRAARHAEDDWFDQTTAVHRFFMDTTNPAALGQSLAFARNFFEANSSGYGLTDADVAQVICLRHRSTPFAFSDAMWAKYGAVLSERADGFLDPKTGQAPIVNVYLANGYGEALKNGGITLDALAKRGVRFAVCGMATRRAATTIAQKTGGKLEDVLAELRDHLVANGRLVPAGIVAVSRAQERGYTFSNVT